MPKSVIPCVVAATLLLAALPTPVLAQVTTSQSALDALGPTSHKPAAHRQAPAHAKPHAPASSHAATAPRVAAHPARQPTKHAAPVTAHAPAATILQAPPVAPVFTAPVINVPLHPPAPPPPVVVVQTATGTASPIADGVRISFGAGSSDVNPLTMQALHDFAARVKAQPESRAILDAAAAGSPDDPSTPRRLALSRGLAARAVLISDGIASTRIYVRMNPTAQAGSDAVDLHLQSNPDGNAPPVSGQTTDQTAPAQTMPAPTTPDSSAATPSPAPAAAPGPTQP